MVPTGGPLVVFKRAIVSGDHKLIVDVRNWGRLLFDVTRDPGEGNDLYQSDPATAQRMEAQYQRWLDR